MAKSKTKRTRKTTKTQRKRSKRYSKGKRRYYKSQYMKRAVRVGRFYGKDRHCTGRQRAHQSGSTGRCFEGYRRDPKTKCCKKTRR